MITLFAAVFVLCVVASSLIFVLKPVEPASENQQSQA